MCRQPRETHTGKTTRTNGPISAPQNEFGDFLTHIATLGGKISFCAENPRESNPNAEY
jgi:hypothetical protein